MSYRAFWQRRCRAAAAEAVLKPLGGNCAVLPLIWSAGLQAVPVNNAIQILLYTIPAVLKIALPGKAAPARSQESHSPEIRFSCALGITVPPSYLSSHVCPLHRVSNQTVPQTVVSSSECDAAASCIVHNPFDRWKGIFIEVSRIYEILFLWDLDAPTYLSPTADGIYLSRS